MEQTVQKLNGCAQLVKYGQKNKQRKKGRGEGEQEAERGKERKITSRITTMEMCPQNTGVLMWKMHNLMEDN